jgi:hypothetical protein
MHMGAVQAGHKYPCNAEVLHAECFRGGNLQKLPLRVITTVEEPDIIVAPDCHAGSVALAVGRQARRS